jgi:hypothetical protein
MDSNPYSNVSWQFNSYMNYRNNNLFSNCFDWFDQYKNIVLIISVLFSLDNHCKHRWTTIPAKLYSFRSEFKKSRGEIVEVHAIYCLFYSRTQSRRFNAWKISWAQIMMTFMIQYFGTNGFKSFEYHCWLSLQSKTRSIVRRTRQHVHASSTCYSVMKFWLSCTYSWNMVNSLTSLKQQPFVSKLINNQTYGIRGVTHKMKPCLLLDLQLLFSNFARTICTVE